MIQNEATEAPFSRETGQGNIYVTPQDHGYEIVQCLEIWSLELAITWLNALPPGLTKYRW